jgi:hypothetical protein
MQEQSTIKLSGKRTLQHPWQNYIERSLLSFSDVASPAALASHPYPAPPKSLLIQNPMSPFKTANMIFRASSWLNRLSRRLKAPLRIIKPLAATPNEIAALKLSVPFALLLKLSLIHATVLADFHIGSVGFTVRQKSMPARSPSQHCLIKKEYEFVS